MSDTPNPFEAFGSLGSEENAKNPFEQSAPTPDSNSRVGSPLVDIGGGEGFGNPFTTAEPQSPTEAPPSMLFDVSAPPVARAEVEPTGGESEEPPADEVEVQEDEDSTGDSEVESDTDADSADEQVSEDVENPLMAAIEGQEKQSIFAKLPVFVHGSAREEIVDIEQTFDALREAKTDDFPELEDAARVSWDITYGAVKKFVRANEAKKTKIGKFKKDIETSKEFTDKLKKSKDKNPTCEIKPRVTAQSKGERMSAYKGVFTSLDEADKSGKIISLVPGSDGKVYEIRKEEMGRFVTPSGDSRELSEIEAGFTPALPLISNQQLMEIVAFFRSFISENGKFEAIANILWDRVDEEFVTVIPKQKVSSATARSDLSEAIDTERYLHYMDIHSHNVMPARFSGTDDSDEKATRLYAVIGRLDQYFPEITVRMSNGGKYQNINPALVFEEFDAEYPCEWNDRVETEKTGFTHKNWGEAA